MSKSASSKALLGVSAALVVGAGLALRSNAHTVAASPPGVPVSGTGGGGVLVTVPGQSSGGVVPRPAPVPGPVMATPRAAAVVPSGPAWAPEPPLSGKTRAQRIAALSSLLAVVNPKAWALSPLARYQFASDLVAVSEAENYPLDILVGHAWAESVLTPAMRPTGSSGAYGPLQVTRIACADVGMAYPPPTVQAACTVGVRLLRLYARRHAEAAGSLTNALRIYGMGYGGFQSFQAAGCSGKPCERAQSVWRAECGCGGQANRYTWKVKGMVDRAAKAGLHTRPWAAWRVHA